MPAPRPDIADLLEVAVPPGGKVITVSDLHLPLVRTDVSGRSCETLARHLAEEPEGTTVVLAGDVVELLGFPEATATDIMRAHEDLCAALLAVTARGGQVIYAIGNHDADLAWDVKAADAVRETTGARLCLSADLILDDGRKIRVEHGHQLDPYNCFHDPRNALDTPMGHHIVREVIPRIEWLGRGWVDGAHEMADPTDFPSFVASRMVYRKLGRRLWWLIAIPLVILIVVRVPVITSFRSRYPDTDVWVHRGEIVGYGAIADLVMLAAVVGILARRAWVAISALWSRTATTGSSPGIRTTLSWPSPPPASTPTRARARRWWRGSAGGSACPRRTSGTSRSAGWNSPPGRPSWSRPGWSCRARPRWSASSPGAATRIRTPRSGSHRGRKAPTGRPRTRKPTARSPSSAPPSPPVMPRLPAVPRALPGGDQQGQPRSAALASSMVSSAAGSASRRSSGMGAPLRTERP